MTISLTDPLTGSSANFGFAYSYNTANQRTRCTLADGSYWAYTNDVLGQVTSGKRYWPDGTIVAGQQFVYDFDDIGNRTSTQAGGDQSGSNLRYASYSANLLNQYTNRTVPSAVDIMGLELATNSVFVNGLTAYRKAEYFRQQLAATNSTAPQWLPVSISATNESAVRGNIFVPQTPEQFTYDADGNLLSDGRFNYTWDAENRLTQVQSLGGSPTASKRMVTWEFDAQGRRIRQTTYDDSSGSYVATEDLKFLSDGWRNIAELNATNNALLRSYLWGADLSGTMDGAGGVGGLLMLSSTANGAHFFAYDGNGNVAALVKAADGTISANYEYEPFGQVLRATGPMASENRFQFSTKRNDRTTDLQLYEYRAHHADLSWISRDPIEEDGGDNVYGFVHNCATASNDPLGLVIDTLCDPIDDYLKSLRISYQRSGKYRYTFSGTSLGTGAASDKMIVTRMLFAAKVFTVSSTGGTAEENLKKHVNARLTIVRNALASNFQFGYNPNFDRTGFFQDPQAFFNRINNGQTELSCSQLSPIIFQTGNNFAPRGVRRRLSSSPADLVWIPSDWGYISNRNYVVGIWRRGLEGENVFHTGTSATGELFWGHFTPGVQPALTESEWFAKIRGWTGGADHGDPAWRNHILYPQVGLERSTDP